MLLHIRGTVSSQERLLMDVYNIRQAPRSGSYNPLFFSALEVTFFLTLSVFKSFDLVRYGAVHVPDLRLVCPYLDI